MAPAAAREIIRDLDIYVLHDLSFANPGEVAHVMVRRAAAAEIHRGQQRTQRCILVLTGLTLLTILLTAVVTIIG